MLEPSRWTVGDVLQQRAAESPDHVALQDDERSWTYGELLADSARCAGALSSVLDVGLGDPVLLMLDNHGDYVTTWLGTALLGAAEVPVNTAYRGGLLAHVVDDSRAKVLVIEDRYCERLAEVEAHVPGLRTVVVRGGDGAALSRGRYRVVPFEALRHGDPAPARRVAPWDLLGIMYTSGTTGRSKGALVTHAHAYFHCHPHSEPSDRILVTLPLFHIAGQWAGVYRALISGARAVVRPRFGVSTFWSDVRRYGCTETLLISSMAHFLHQQAPRADDADNPLQRVNLGPVIPDVEGFARRFGVKVCTAYGLTEGSSPLFADYGEAVTGGCGRVRDGFTVKLVDEHDVEVPRGELGELLIRADLPWVTFSGYHGMPEATARAWRNLWLHTGDLMREDETGQFYFHDRNADVIRRRGENISSFEIEAELNAQPAVRESAVVGVSSEYSEQEVMAVVVPRDGCSIAPEDLLSSLRDRLPYFMLPRFVEFVDEMPKTATGRVRKGVLRSRGVTGATWDREAAGFRVARDG